MDQRWAQWHMLHIYWPLQGHAHISITHNLHFICIWRWTSMFPHISHVCRAIHHKISIQTQNYWNFVILIGDPPGKCSCFVDNNDELNKLSEQLKQVSQKVWENISWHSFYFLKFLIGALGIQTMVPNGPLVGLTSKIILANWCWISIYLLWILTSY